MILFIIILSYSIVNSQVKQKIKYDEWVETNFVDQFGDKLNKTTKVYFTKGKFSNSATVNSDLIVRITEFKKSFHISLYEYGTAPEARLNSGSAKIASVSFKDAMGNIRRGGVRLHPSGGLIIKKRTKLGKILLKNKPIQVYISEYNTYHNSTYGFKLF
ncbi:hypothetical protein [Tenacibaculum soleae]|uniref:hypothetical protein n=1 Tax=Tenacibaculum soleae TaxID=447689 RepID=UPI00230044F8|nr:hypothetical protein [Tenacibaculum soleae]